MSNLEDHEAEQAAITARYEPRGTHLKVWHCYWYGPYDTIILLAETNDLLEAKVREAIAAGWYPEDDGPMPDDFGDLIEKYREISGDTCYFGDWTYTVIDTTLCDVVQEDEL